MEHHQKNMARKWERHYRETKTVCAGAMILFGLVFAIPLVLIYPQQFSKVIFNSRMAYHLIIDSEDYFTCDKDYINFIIDEPRENLALYNFYVFNVTNSIDVITRGYKPYIKETGPYGYRKLTYKYDVSFSDDFSRSVSFKEYNRLEYIPPHKGKYCRDMYFRMERAFSDLTDPCLSGMCDCHDHDSIVTIINPLFLKLIWEDSPHKVLALFSVEVFQTIKDYLEGPFVKAAKLHLVNKALNEIYILRQTFQVYSLLDVTFSYIMGGPSAGNVTYQDTALLMENATYVTTYNLQHPQSPLSVINTGCANLLKARFAQFGDVPPDCNMQAYYPLNLAKAAAISQSGSTIKLSDFPSILPFLDKSSNISFLHADVGFPRWVGVILAESEWRPGGTNGFIMASHAVLDDIFHDLVLAYAKIAFNTPLPTVLQLSTCRAVVQGLAQYIATKWIIPYAPTTLTYMNYDEFLNTYEPVICTPLGLKCMWQFGYMRKYNDSNLPMNRAMIRSMIDLTTVSRTNPNSLFFPFNGAHFYNSYTYCSKIYYPPVKPNLPCEDLNFTFNDGRVNTPAGFWSSDAQVSTVNKTYLYLVYKNQSEEVKRNYLLFSCNVSYFLYEIYPTVTNFHDQFVVNYLNAEKDPLFAHNFTVDNFLELGWAQFGGGYVTYALQNVRSVYEMTRDGVWRFGDESYISSLIEYGSWSIAQGFPWARIDSVADSKTLLYALSRRDAIGEAFRQHVVYSGTTFVGNGKDIVNGVGAVGEFAYTTEANMGNFSCSRDSVYFSYEENIAPCEVLNVFITSSPQQCLDIETEYAICFDNIFKGEQWITNCGRFETSMTSAVQGIQCDLNFVYGQPHPYTKSRGNILFQMLFSLTMDLRIKAGLWCPRFEGCTFQWGGLFTTTSVKKVLFEGYTEPGVLRYLNMRHERDGIHIRCAENYQDSCGRELLQCNDAGLVLTMPLNNVFKISYKGLPKDQFFAPFYEMTSDEGQLIWRYSMDPDVVETAMSTIARYSQTPGVSIVRIFNPYWAAYPGWHTNDTKFLKFIQCQKRTLMGPPFLFASCVDVLDTGREDILSLQNIKVFAGNTSIHTKNAVKLLNVKGSTTAIGGAMYMWDGFINYPYPFQFNTMGPDHRTLDGITIFNKQYGFNLFLSQSEFLFEFQKEIPLPIPLTDSFERRNFTKTIIYGTRRFAETESSWEALNVLGSPKDSYGMPYKIPLGMYSIELLSGFPVYLGTPHCYGNYKWGGTEYSHVSGYTPDQRSQWTFTDYDSVTGKVFRFARRHQINLRVERGPLFINIISNQRRCIPPTKSFSGSTGYGCFAYVPLLWFDESRVVDTFEFYRTQDHFYTRPNRAAFLSLVGLIVGIILVFMGTCLCINEAYFRRKFMRRVYVD